MKFEDVEKARVKYVEKQKNVQKKAVLVTIIIVGVILLVRLLTTTRDVRRIFAQLFDFSVTNIMLLIFAVLLVCFFVYVVANLVARFSTREESHAYVYAYKAYFISQQLAKTFTDLKYDHYAGLNKALLDATGMIYTGDRYLSNDLTQGKYKNVNFSQADVTIQREVKDGDTDTTVRYITVFKGRYMIFEFPKKFDFRMVVTSHATLITPRGRKGREFKHIELESPEFNKFFEVYAEDGFEAFYILDPAIISSIEDLGREYEYRLTLYFDENKLIIGINNGNDSFEPPSPNKPLDEAKELEKVTKEIKTITHFVDMLKLDK